MATPGNSSRWQPPFVDVFKLVKYGPSNTTVQSKDESPLPHEKVRELGHVSRTMDRTLGKSVLRLAGSVGASNYIEFPKDPKGSLGLSGRYLYLQVKAIRGKPFSFHVEVSGRNKCELPHRISCSNMYKSHSRRGDKIIQLSLADITDKWTVVALDIPKILCMSLSPKKKGGKSSEDGFGSIKSLKFCANLSVRGAYSSDFIYSFSGKHALPGNVNFPLRGGVKDWQESYDFRWFPEEPVRPLEVGAKENTVSNSAAVSVDAKLQAEMQARKKTSPTVVAETKEESIMGSKKSNEASRAEMKDKVSSRRRSTWTRASMHSSHMLKVNTLIGYNSNVVKFSADGQSVIYPCATSIILTDVENPSGHNQRILAGHTNKVNCLALNYAEGTRKILASTEEGRNPLIRIWDIESGHVVTMIAAHPGGINCLEMSDDGRLLAAVGKDEHNRVQIVVWVLQLGNASEKAKLMAKQTSEFDIRRIKFSPFDYLQLVTCGRENIRFWRIKNGHLPGRPVILNEYARNTIFSDIAIERSYGEFNIAVAGEKRLFVSSELGTVVVVGFESLSLLEVVQLHDGPISSISINEGFCITGAKDNFVRVWPLHFKEFFLESKHEGEVGSVDLSPDGLKVAIGSVDGIIGMLDITSQSYSPVLRAHYGSIHDVAFRPREREFATASEDGSVRVWNLPDCQEIYDFKAKKDVCLCLCYHPTKNFIISGFRSGATRILDVARTVLAYEYVQHKSPVSSVCITADASKLLTSGTDGNLCVYDALREFQPMRIVNNVSLNIKTVDGKESMPEVSCSMDGKIVVHLSPGSQEISIYRIESMTCLLSVVCPDKTGAGFSIARIAPFISDRGDCTTYEILTATEDNRIQKYRVVEARDGAKSKWSFIEVQDVASTHIDGVEDMDISPGGNFLITVGMDNLVKVWEYSLDPTSIQTFVGHNTSVNRIRFSTDSKHIVSISEDSTMRLWSFNGEDSPPPPPRPAPVKPKPKKLRTRSSSRPEPPPPPPGRKTKPNSKPLDVLPSKHLTNKALNSKDRRVSFDTREMSFDTSFRDNVIWHPQSGLLMYSMHNKLKMEDLASGARATYQVNETSISKITVSANAEIVATALVGSDTHPANIGLWIFNNDIMRFESTILDGHPIGIQDMAVSDDNKYLVSVGNQDDGVLHVWEIATRLLRWTGKLAVVTHAVAWVAGLPVSVGANASVTKWMLNSDGHEAVGETFCTIDPPSCSPGVHNTCIVAPSAWFADLFKAENIVGISDNRGVCRIVSLEGQKTLTEWKAVKSGMEITDFSWKDKYMVFAAGDEVVAWDVGKALPAEEEIGEPAAIMPFSGNVISTSWESLGKEGIVAVDDGNIWYTNVEQYTSMLLNPDKSAEASTTAT